jgi:hypothetical protein
MHQPRHQRGFFMPALVCVRTSLQLPWFVSYKPINQPTIMNNQPTQIIYKDGLQFDNRYIEHKSYFMALHNCVPNLNLVSPMDGEKALTAFREAFADHIEQVHTYHWFKREKRHYVFYRSIVQMKEAITIEFGDSYCEMLHDGTCDELIDRMTKLFSKYLERRKREPQEINLIVRGDYGLELKALEIKRTKLDINLYYEDDFKEIDAIIRQRLSKKNDKGIVLLHGLPGTGKTTYLRYLAGVLKKRVLFLSPSVAGSLMEPSFIDLLIDHPNSVIIIEDAEHIIMDRRIGGGSSVSNLLNISDGLLADFLNVQLICTFNSSLTMVDSALMRKGRLIAKYEFGKLSQKKAERLSKHMGLGQIVEGPMTLAEVMHPGEQSFESTRMEVIGFRRAVLEN